MWSVYMHTSPSGKVYIGITSKDPIKRWSNRWGYLNKKNGKYIQSLFANAILKYGWDNIKHEVLYINLSKEEACNKEIELIKKYKEKGLSYNLTDGGEGYLGYKASIETREKISNSLKGKPSKLKGTKRSEHTKLKISMAAKIRGVSKEILDKLHSNNRGKKFSEERCKNIGKSNPKCRKVLQLDIEGNIIRKYYSMGEASKENNIPYTTMVQYVKNNRFGRGFYWKLDDN